MRRGSRRPSDALRRESSAQAPVAKPEAAAKYKLVFMASPAAGQNRGGEAFEQQPIVHLYSDETNSLVGEDDPLYYQRLKLVLLLLERPSVDANSAKATTQAMSKKGAEMLKRRASMSKSVDTGVQSVLGLRRADLLCVKPAMRLGQGPSVIVYSKGVHTEVKHGVGQFEGTTLLLEASGAYAMRAELFVPEVTNQMVLDYSRRYDAAQKEADVAQAAADHAGPSDVKKAARAKTLQAAAAKAKAMARLKPAPARTVRSDVVRFRVKTGAPVQCLFTRVPRRQPRDSLPTEVRPALRRAERASVAASQIQAVAGGGDAMQTSGLSETVHMRPADEVSVLTQFGGAAANGVNAVVSSSDEDEQSEESDNSSDDAGPTVATSATRRKKNDRTRGLDLLQVTVLDRGGNPVSSKDLRRPSFWTAVGAADVAKRGEKASLTLGAMAHDITKDNILVDEAGGQVPAEEAGGQRPALSFGGGARVKGAASRVKRRSQQRSKQTQLFVQLVVRAFSPALRRPAPKCLGTRPRQASLALSESDSDADSENGDSMKKLPFGSFVDTNHSDGSRDLRSIGGTKLLTGITISTVSLGNTGIADFSSVLRSLGAVGAYVLEARVVAGTPELAARAAMQGDSMTFDEDSTVTTVVSCMCEPIVLRPAVLRFDAQLFEEMEARRDGGSTGPCGFKPTAGVVFQSGPTLRIGLGCDGSDESSNKRHRKPVFAHESMNDVGEQITQGKLAGARVRLRLERLETGTIGHTFAPEFSDDNDDDSNDPTTVHPSEWHKAQEEENTKGPLPAGLVELGSTRLWHENVRRTSQEAVLSKFGAKWVQKSAAGHGQAAADKAEAAAAKAKKMQDVCQVTYINAEEGASIPALEGQVNFAREHLFICREGNYALWADLPDFPDIEPCRWPPRPEQRLAPVDAADAADGDAPVTDVVEIGDDAIDFGRALVVSPVRLEIKTPGPAGQVMGGDRFPEQPIVRLFDANDDPVFDGPAATALIRIRLDMRPSLSSSFSYVLPSMQHSLEVEAKKTVQLEQEARARAAAEAALLADEEVSTPLILAGTAGTANSDANDNQLDFAAIVKSAQAKHSASDRRASFIDAIWRIAASDISRELRCKAGKADWSFARVRDQLRLYRAGWYTIEAAVVEEVPPDAAKMKREVRRGSILFSSEIEAINDGEDATEDGGDARTRYEHRRARNYSLRIRPKLSKEFEVMIGPPSTVEFIREPAKDGKGKYEIGQQFDVAPCLVIRDLAGNKVTTKLGEKTKVKLWLLRASCERKPRMPTQNEAADKTAPVSTPQDASKGKVNDSGPGGNYFNWLKPEKDEQTFRGGTSEKTKRAIKGVVDFADNKLSIMHGGRFRLGATIIQAAGSASVKQAGLRIASMLSTVSAADIAAADAKARGDDVDELNNDEARAMRPEDSCLSEEIIIAPAEMVFTRQVSGNSLGGGKSLGGQKFWIQPSVSILRNGNRLSAAGELAKMLTAKVTLFIHKGPPGASLVSTTFENSEWLPSAVIDGKPVDGGNACVQNQRRNSLIAQQGSRLFIPQGSRKGREMAMMPAPGGVTIVAKGDGTADFREAKLGLDKEGTYTLGVVTLDFPDMLIAYSAEVEVTAGPPTRIEVARWPDDASVSTVAANARISTRAPFPVQPVIILKDLGGNVVRDEIMDPGTHLALRIVSGPKGGGFIVDAAEAARNAADADADGEATSRSKTKATKMTKKGKKMPDSQTKAEGMQSNDGSDQQVPKRLKGTVIVTKSKVIIRAGKADFSQSPLRLSRAGVYHFEAYVDNWKYKTECCTMTRPLHILPSALECTVQPGPSGELTGGVPFGRQPVLSLLDTRGQPIAWEDIGPIVQLRMRHFPCRSASSLANVAHKGCFNGGKQQCELPLRRGVADWSSDPLAVDVRGWYEIEARLLDEPDVAPCIIGPFFVDSGPVRSLIFDVVPGPIPPSLARRAGRKNTTNGNEDSGGHGEDAYESAASSADRVSPIAAEASLIASLLGDGPPVPPKRTPTSAKRKYNHKENKKFETRLIVKAVDAGGNVAVRYPVSVTLSIDSGPPHASFYGGVHSCNAFGPAGVVDFSEHPLVPSGSLSGVFTLNITAQIGRSAPKEALVCQDANNQDVRQPDGDDTSGQQHGTMQVSCLSSDIEFTPAQLRFYRMPGPVTNLTGGSAFEEQPIIEVCDANGERISTGPLACVTVTLLIEPGGPVGGAFGFGRPGMQGTRPPALSTCVKAECGLADFTPQQLLLDVTGTYSLYARVEDWPHIHGISSGDIVVQIGRPHHLHWEAQPSSSSKLATGGQPFPVQPRISVRDPGDNIIVHATSRVTLRIKHGPAPLPDSDSPLARPTFGTFIDAQRVASTYCKHSAIGSAECDLTDEQIRQLSENDLAVFERQISATAGIADFGVALRAGKGASDVSVAALARAGSYVLTAFIETEDTLIEMDSEPFVVTEGPPAIVEYAVPPGTRGASLSNYQEFPMQPVARIRDAGGNVVCGCDGHNAEVQIRLKKRPSSRAQFATCHDAVRMRACRGIADFGACSDSAELVSHGLMLTLPGSYILSLSLPEWPDVADCDSMELNVGNSKLRFVQQPGPSLCSLPDLANCTNPDSKGDRLTADEYAQRRRTAANEGKFITGGCAFPQQPKLELRGCDGVAITRGPMANAELELKTRTAAWLEAAFALEQRGLNSDYWTEQQHQSDADDKTNLSTSSKNGFAGESQCIELSSQEANQSEPSESEDVPAVKPRAQVASSVFQGQIGSTVVHSCGNGMLASSPSSSQFCERPLPRAPGTSFFADHGADIAERLAQCRDLCPSNRERLRASPRPLPSTDQLEPEPYVPAAPVLREFRASGGVVDLRLAHSTSVEQSLQGDGLAIDAAGAFALEAVLSTHRTLSAAIAAALVQRVYVAVERKHEAAKQALEQARERETQRSVVGALWQQGVDNFSSTCAEQELISVFDAQAALKRQEAVAKLVRSSVIAVHDIDNKCCYVRVCRASIVHALNGGQLARRLARRKSGHNWNALGAGLGRAVNETRKESLGRGKHNNRAMTLTKNDEVDLVFNDMRIQMREVALECAKEAPGINFTVGDSGVICVPTERKQTHSLSSPESCAGSSTPVGGGVCISALESVSRSRRLLQRRATKRSGFGKRKAKNQSDALPNVKDQPIAEHRSQKSDTFDQEVDAHCREINCAVRALSVPFEVAFGAPARLLVKEPSGRLTGGLPFENQPVVTIQDAGGNVVRDASDEITLAKASGPGTLYGQTRINAKNGIADFAGCGLFFDKVGEYGIYQITCALGVAIMQPSRPFTIVPGPVAQVFVSVPGGAVEGGCLFTENHCPVVLLQDAGGNTCPFAFEEVELWKEPNRGARGELSHLRGRVKTSADKGVASFEGHGLLIDKVGMYRLCASVCVKRRSDGTWPGEDESEPGDTSPGVLRDPEPTERNFEGHSALFEVREGPPAQLSICPPGVRRIYSDDNGGIWRHRRAGLLLATVPFEVQPSVTVQDAGGNTLTQGVGATARITLALDSGGRDGVELQPLSACVMDAVAGVAVFGHDMEPEQRVAPDRMLYLQVADRFCLVAHAPKLGLVQVSRPFTVAPLERVSLVRTVPLHALRALRQVMFEMLRNGDHKNETVDSGMVQAALSASVATAGKKDHGETVLARAVEVAAAGAAMATAAATTSATAAFSTAMANATKELRKDEVGAHRSSWDRKQEADAKVAATQATRQRIAGKKQYELKLRALTEGLGLTELMRHERYLRPRTMSSAVSAVETIRCVGSLSGVVVNVSTPKGIVNEPPHAFQFMLQQERMGVIAYAQGEEEQEQLLQLRTEAESVSTSLPLPSIPSQLLDNLRDINRTTRVQEQGLGQAGTWATVVPTRRRREVDDGGVIVSVPSPIGGPITPRKLRAIAALRSADERPDVDVDIDDNLEAQVNGAVPSAQSERVTMPDSTHAPAAVPLFTSADPDSAISVSSQYGSTHRFSALSLSQKAQVEQLGEANCRPGIDKVVGSHDVVSDVAPHVTATASRPCTAPGALTSDQHIAQRTQLVTALAPTQFVLRAGPGGVTTQRVEASVALKMMDAAPERAGTKQHRYTTGPSTFIAEPDSQRTIAAARERVGDDDIVAFRVIGPVLRLERRRCGGVHPLPEGTSTQVHVSVPHFCEPNLAKYLDKHSCSNASTGAVENDDLNQCRAPSRATLAANLGLINVVHGTETLGSDDGTQTNQAQASGLTRDHARVMLAFTDGQPGTRLRLCQGSRCGVTRGSMENYRHRDGACRTRACAAVSGDLQNNNAGECDQDALDEIAFVEGEVEVAKCLWVAPVLLNPAAAARIALQMHPRLPAPVTLACGRPYLIRLLAFMPRCGVMPDGTALLRIWACPHTAEGLCRAQALEQLHRHWGSVRCDDGRGGPLAVAANELLTVEVDGRFGRFRWGGEGKQRLAQDADGCGDFEPVCTDIHIHVPSYAHNAGVSSAHTDLGNKGAKQCGGDVISYTHTDANQTDGAVNSAQADIGQLSIDLMGTAKDGAGNQQRERKGPDDLQQQQEDARPKKESKNGGADVVLLSSRRRRQPASQSPRQNSQKQRRGYHLRPQGSWSRRRTVRVWGACERDGQSHTLAHGGIGGRTDADNANENQDERLSFEIELSIDLTAFGMAPVDNNAGRPSRLALDASDDLCARRCAVSCSKALWSAQHSAESRTQDTTTSRATPSGIDAFVNASAYQVNDSHTANLSSEAEAEAEAEAQAVRNRMLSIHESMADTSVGGQLQRLQSPPHSPHSPQSPKSPNLPTLAFWSSSAPMAADESAAATVKWFDKINVDRSVGNASTGISEGFYNDDENSEGGAPGGKFSTSVGKVGVHMDNAEHGEAEAPTSKILATETWEAKRDVVSRSRQPLLVSSSTGHALFFEVPPVLRWLETLCDAQSQTVGLGLGANASIKSGELLALDTQAAGDAEADWLPSNECERVLSLAQARQCFLYLQNHGLDDFEQLFRRGAGMENEVVEDHNGKRRRQRHSKDAIQAAERFWKQVLRGAIGDGVDVQARAVAARAIVASLRRTPRLTRYSRDPLQLTVGEPTDPIYPLLAPGSGVVRTFSGLLPQGLVLDRTSGVISGTPIVVTPELGFRITASSPVGSSTYDFVICVADPRALS